MTLIVALKYKNGIVLAADTRIIYGESKRDETRKLEPLTENIGTIGSGLLGAIDDVLGTVRAFCQNRPVSFDGVVSCLSDTNHKWYESNFEKLDEEDRGGGGPTFILTSNKRIRRIFPRGYSEEAYDYACEGSGRDYGEYILRNFYREGLKEEEAKELAIHTIVETSKMDPNVSEDLQMIIFPKEGKCKDVTRQEIESIKEYLTPTFKKISEMQIGTVESIVKTRQAINDIWNKAFGFKLLLSDEGAILQLAKPCRKEEEFTHNIATLALLIDQINIEEIKKGIDTEEPGSINLLEKFLGKYAKDFPSEIISNLRDIVTLRSKRFPIHQTDPKLVDTVLRLVGRYPPVPADLWQKALTIYKESIDRLLEYSQKNLPRHI